MGINSNSEIEQKVVESIEWLIGEFQQAPYRFLYESDLQAMLLYDLRCRINTSIQIPRKARSENADIFYKLDVVNSEYKSKIDIACIDLEEVTESAANPHKGFDTYIYNLPVFAGIELKYRKMGDIFGFESCVCDFNKLEALSVPRPFILGFLQDEKDVKSFLYRKPAEWVCSTVSGDVQAGVIAIITRESISTYSRTPDSI